MADRPALGAVIGYYCYDLEGYWILYDDLSGGIDERAKRAL